MLTKTGISDKNACAGLMQPLTVDDLSKQEALQFARFFRQRSHEQARQVVEALEDEEEVLRKALSIIGGRIPFIMKLCNGKWKSADELLTMAENMVRRERAWLLNSIGLIPKIEGEVTKEVSPDLLTKTRVW